MNTSQYKISKYAEYHSVLSLPRKDGMTIQYGVMRGDSTVVFIKTGRGGHIFGENKNQRYLYVNLANEIYNKFGYSVIVAENPLEEKMSNPLDADLENVSRLLQSDVRPTVIYVGYSAGANYGAWYGYKYTNIAKMLLINPIINLNLHRTLDCCKNFAGEMVFAAGENDSSAMWLKILPQRKNIKSKILSNQEHHLQSDVFMSLVLDFVGGC